MEKRLYRSRSNRMIWGVCGGLAEYFDIDPTIVRIIAVLLLLAKGVGVLAYIILAIVVPLEKSRAETPKETIKENVEEIAGTAREFGREVRATFGEEGKKSITGGSTRYRSHIVIGLIIIAVGMLLLLSNVNLLWWLRWSYLWPIPIIVVGLLVIFGARRK